MLSQSYKFESGRQHDNKRQEIKPSAGFTVVQCGSCQKAILISHAGVKTHGFNREDDNPHLFVCG